MNIIRSTIIIPVAALLLSGCATPQRSEYAAFAQAGSGYAAAVDKLLVAAGEAQVDSTSWTLVGDKNDGGIDEATYKKRTQEDIDRLTELRRLRTHAQLLGNYFVQLEVLATSDAPDRAKSAIKGVVKSITDLSLSSSEALPALPTLGRGIVDANIRAALKEELTSERKEVLRKELQLQKVLLTQLSGQIAVALKEAKQIKEFDLVITPLIAGGSPLVKPENWVAKRHEVMYMSETVEELKLAATAACKMQVTFDALLSGEDVTGSINSLIIDIERILTIAEAIN
ncbi:MAG: hypothetical protein D3916_11710 [Candidatus Electrothrix sp. MAN1_4]|nr:hypothetical protein [Candidatus Electrothrix sp. MAN1_4]